MVLRGGFFFSPSLPSICTSGTVWALKAVAKGKIEARRNAETVNALRLVKKGSRRKRPVFIGIDTPVQQVYIYRVWPSIA